MKKNSALKLASFIFGLIAVLHLLRAIFQSPASIANFDVPVYISYIAFVIAGYLSWLMYKSSKSK